MNWIEYKSPRDLPESGFYWVQTKDGSIFVLELLPPGEEHALETATFFLQYVDYFQKIEKPEKYE